MATGSPAVGAPVVTVIAACTPGCAAATVTMLLAVDWKPLLSVVVRPIVKTPAAGARTVTVEAE